MSLEKKRNISGVFWSGMERLLVQLTKFVVSVILARILLPSDYGIVAMMTIVLDLSASLVDSGFAQSLIQQRSKREADLSTALIFNLASALGVYALIYALAPLIADFYGVERLVPVARILSLVLLVNALSVVQQSLLAIDLNFKRLAKFSFIAYVMGGLAAILAALLGAGLWALVLQQVLAAAVQSTLLWLSSSWRPKVGFSRESFSRLWAFGSRMLFVDLLASFYNNMYTMVIGRYFGAKDLGYYNRATTFAALPSINIGLIVERALYPMLCREGLDVEAAAQRMFRYLRMIFLFVVPAMLALALLSGPFVSLALGERWAAVVPLLQAISLAYILDPTARIVGAFIKSQGRSDLLLRSEFLRKIVGVSILLIALPGGLHTICWFLILYSFFDVSLILIFSRQISKEVGFRAFLRVFVPILLLCLPMAGTVWLTQEIFADNSPLLRLLIGALSGTAVYGLCFFVFYRDLSRELINIIRGFFNKK